MERKIGEVVNILEDGKVVKFQIGAILITDIIRYKRVGAGIDFDNESSFTDEDILTDEQVKELDVWKPKFNEKYWTIDSYGGVFVSTWDVCNIDIGRYELGNVYQTEELATFALQKQKYLTQYKRYIETHNRKMDWSDIFQAKYYAYWDNRIEKLSLDSVFYSRHALEIYATSAQIIKDFIKLIGDDNFKKYILEVE